KEGRTDSRKVGRSEGWRGRHRVPVPLPTFRLSVLPSFRPASHSESCFPVFPNVFVAFSLAFSSDSGFRGSFPLAPGWIGCSVRWFLSRSIEDFLRSLRSASAMVCSKGRGSRPDTGAGRRSGSNIGRTGGRGCGVGHGCWG